MHFIWAQYLQVLSLILSIVFMKGLSKFKLTGLIPLLFLVCVTEFIGSNRLYFGWKNNYFIYDVYIILSFPITYYVYDRMLSFLGWVRVIYYSVGVLVLIFFMLNILFIQGSKKFDTYSFILLAFLTTLLSLLVLIRLFKEDDFNIMLYDHPYFWISGATLIFNIGTLVILGLQQYIETQKIQIDGKNIYRILTPIMNILLYGGYSYAFVLCNKLTHKLSRQ